MSNKMQETKLTASNSVPRFYGSITYVFRLPDYLDRMFGGGRKNNVGSVETAKIVADTLCAIDTMPRSPKDSFFRTIQDDDSVLAIVMSDVKANEDGVFYEFRFDAADGDPDSPISNGIEIFKRMFEEHPHQYFNTTIGWDRFWSAFNKSAWEIRTDEFFPLPA